MSRPIKFRKKKPLTGATSIKKYKLLCKIMACSQLEVMLGDRLEYLGPTNRNSKNILAISNIKNSIPNDWWLQVHPQAVSAVAIAQECLYRMQPSATQASLRLELYATSTEAIVCISKTLTGATARSTCRLPWSASTLMRIANGFGSTCSQPIACRKIHAVG
jgi:hypothetical protein